MKRQAIITALLVALGLPSLSGCQTTAIVSSSNQTFEYPGCDTATNEDVFGGVSFMTAHQVGIKDYGCAIVSKADGFPVFDGTQSARFEVRPGDCSGGRGGGKGWSDCANDRSRHEIHERWPTNCFRCLPESTEGQLLTYELSVYIPSKPKIMPRGANILNLVQINVLALHGMVTDKLTGLPFLTYSQAHWASDHDTLQIWTNHGSTWKVKRMYPVVEDPLDKWIKFKFEIYSTSGKDGYLKVFVNDELKVHEIRPTLPQDQDATTHLRFGIYNAYLSKATEPYGKQVVYFDAISKSVGRPTGTSKKVSTLDLLQRLKETNSCHIPSLKMKVLGCNPQGLDPNCRLFSCNISDAGTRCRPFLTSPMPSRKFSGDCDLRGADLQEASLQDADLREANLQGANLRGTNFQGADLREANLQGANLQGAMFPGAFLWKANLEEANLQGANLEDANLNEANLQGANLRGTNLQGADLWGTYLQDADLRNANLEGADLGAADFKTAALRGVALRGADLRGADLRGANLRGTKLQGADLWGTNLGAADLRNANLEGADLGDANLNEANLQGAILEKATLWRANLRGTNLQGADLRGANLRRCELRGANLQRSDLRGANLGDAKLDSKGLAIARASGAIGLSE